MTVQRSAIKLTATKVAFLAFALTSLLTACTAAPAPAPTVKSSSAQAAQSSSPTTASGATDPSSTPATATFDGMGFGVAFSFQYPAFWIVNNAAPSNQEGGPFVISNESNVEVASLSVFPFFSVDPCTGICADIPVSYLGDVPGHGTLAGKTYTVQTKAMDLTSRKDLQDANNWKGNVRLIVGITGVPATTGAEDPFHFTTRAGIQVGSSIDSLRPIRFIADHYFNTMAEAKAYTSSKEYSQIQAMMSSLTATPTAGNDSAAPRPTATESALR